MEYFTVIPEGQAAGKQGGRNMKPASINLATVLIALRNGFGVEDIAVGTGQPDLFIAQPVAPTQEKLL